MLFYHKNKYIINNNLSLKKTKYRLLGYIKEVKK